MLKKYFLNLMLLFLPFLINLGMISDSMNEEKNDIDLGIATDIFDCIENIKSEYEFETNFLHFFSSNGIFSDNQTSLDNFIGFQIKSDPNTSILNGNLDGLEVSGFVDIPIGKLNLLLITGYTDDVSYKFRSEYTINDNFRLTVGSGENKTECIHKTNFHYTGLFNAAFEVLNFGDNFRGYVSKDFTLGENKVFFGLGKNKESYILLDAFEFGNISISNRNIINLGDSNEWFYRLLFLLNPYKGGCGDIRDIDGFSGTRHIYNYDILPHPANPRMPHVGERAQAGMLIQHQRSDGRGKTGIGLAYNFGIKELKHVLEEAESFLEYLERTGKDETCQDQISEYEYEVFKEYFEYVVKEIRFNTGKWIGIDIELDDGFNTEKYGLNGGFIIKNNNIIKLNVGYDVKDGFYGSLNIIRKFW